MDFTVKKYKELLISLVDSGYHFQSFSEFIKEPKSKVILLRHDVDDRKLNSLEFAKIQHSHGIRGTFYFRMVPKSYDENVIKEIYDLGHEVGYHYEDMDFVDGNIDEAIKLFEKHLEKLRQIAPIDTICMHGSPRSKYDNKDVWNKYDYRDYGIIGEPYFDINFEEVFYLTDTGRMWDGSKFSVRDKVKTSATWPIFHSTDEIISNLKKEEFPNKVMFNFHPQRWTDNSLLWLKEGMLQFAKNQIKRAKIIVSQ